MGQTHNFDEDSRFFIENYGTLLNLHAGKFIVIAHRRVLFVTDSELKASEWADTFGISGKCTILQVSPKTYSEQSEGIPI